MKFVRLVKIAALSLLACLLLGVAFIYYLFSLSPEARDGQRNMANLRRVHLGMSQRQALALVGPPKAVHAPPGQEKGIIYVYTSHPLAASEYYLHIGPDSTVQAIGLGE